MSTRSGLRKLLLLAAVFLLLVPVVPSASAQTDGPFFTWVSATLHYGHEGLVPGQVYELHGQLETGCGWGTMPSSPEQLNGVEAHRLSVNTTHPGLVASVSPSTYFLDWTPHDCLTNTGQSREFTVTLAFAEETEAYKFAHVQLLVEHDWGPPAATSFAAHSAFTGGVDVQVPTDVSLEPEVTTLVPFVFTNTANSAVVVDADAALRSLSGPQPDLPVFTLAVGETRVVHLPVATSDTGPATGVLEVRFDAYSADNVDAAADMDRVRVDLVVGDGSAPATGSVEEAPALPLFALLAGVASVALLRHRWRV